MTLASLQKYLSYEALPINARDAAYDGFVNVGFSREAILDEYSLSDEAGKQVKINALAFAHTKYRTLSEYAGFTLYNATNELSNEALVRVLAQSTAPFHLIHRQTYFSFWASSVQDNQVEPFLVASSISYDQLQNVLDDYSIDLNPQRIIDVKQGRSQFTHPAFASKVEPLQLSLWAMDVTRPLLLKHFGNAVNQLRENLAKEEVVVDIATQLLGIAILADTGVLGDEVRKDETKRDLSRLISLAHNYFPNYFKVDLFNKYFDIANQAYHLLRQIRYVGFVPDMLTELYTEAYNIERRKELGRYDTPLYLTRRIWQTIPVEFLPPKERVIVDMTCGWGSFLLAGYERLSHLHDMKNFSLRDFIHGNDKDPLAARLAGLGLLISTSEDSWHVDATDALQWKWLNTNRPNIIVGNPPFEGDRRKTSPNRNKRYQKADQFLKQAISRLSPGGYLAMLMPQSFGVAEASPTLRKYLLEHSDLLELWELPIGIFPDATAGTLVIFAQKVGGPHKIREMPTRVRTLQRQTREKFEKLGVFTSSNITPSQSAWGENSRRSKNSQNTHLMNYKLVLSEEVWKNIHSVSLNLQDVAIVFQGAIAGNPKRWRWKDYPSPKQVPWLIGAQEVIPRQFYIEYGKASTIIYPNELEEPRKSKNPEYDKEELLLGRKILLTSNQNPSWGKRVTVAIEDRGGYCVSNSFWVVALDPKAKISNLSLKVIAAVLNWKVSNAWIVEHLKYTKINEFAIKYIPFPRNLIETDCRLLAEMVDKFQFAVVHNQPEPKDAIQVVDSILKSAYELDEETYKRLSMIYEWDKEPKITLDTQPDTDARWKISGVVEDVNALGGTIKLWLNGLDYFETVPIVSTMPGWMLRPNVAFRTTIPRRCVREQSLANVSWGSFFPQENTYLNDEEIFDQLTDAFHAPDELL
jgi:hypothetical protein